VFEEILGIPAHPLLLHAAVVFIPLQVLFALAYAFVPWARRNAAWAVAALVVVAPGAALLAKLSGDALRARLVRNHTVSPQGLVNIDNHRSYGTMTVYWTAGLAVLMLVMLLAQRTVVRGTAQAGVMIQPNGSMAVGAILSVVVLAVAVVTGYYVFKTGDTGAHTVWSSL
jgi:Predicted membrane protein (DUF2231)